MVVDAGLDDAGHDSSTWNAAGDAPGNAEDNARGPDDPSSQDNTGRRGGNANARATADLPDPRKLAQDWITLWQSELSAMAVDPEMRESWQTVMALWAGTMSTMLRGLSRAPSADRHERAGEHTRAADAPRAAPAAAAPDPRDAEIERLARHVATLERRLADLEHRGRPAVDPKRRAPRKPAK